MGELKYLTVWKDGRLIFMKRKEFIEKEKVEPKSLWRRFFKKIRRLVAR